MQNFDLLKVYIRSGAGIAAAGNPESEYQECLNKAATMQAALERAHRYLSYRDDPVRFFSANRPFVLSSVSPVLCRARFAGVFSSPMLPAHAIHHH